MVGHERRWYNEDCGARPAIAGRAPRQIRGTYFSSRRAYVETIKWPLTAETSNARIKVSATAGSIIRCSSALDIGEAAPAPLNARRHSPSCDSTNSRDRRYPIDESRNTEATQSAARGASSPCFRAG